MRFKHFYNSTKIRIAHFLLDVQTILIIIFLAQIVHTIAHVLKDAKPEDILKAVEEYDRKHSHDN